ncbi:MAG: KTSC domain-containing protein [Pseudomonadales bacterium]|nr:KTSC domain-containing protein [Pseudomonadales bacterium]
MNVELTSVSSSNVAAVGYDVENETVYVQFLNGSEYIYKGVPQHDFDGLLNAPSVGSYLHRNFKNVYPYERTS